MNTFTDYSDYLIKISSDPAYYGHECTQEQATRTALAIEALVQAQFPGLRTHVLLPTEFAPQVVLGPDPDVVLHIVDWLNTHWAVCLDAADPDDDLRLDAVFRALLTKTDQGLGGYVDTVSYKLANGDLSRQQVAHLCDLPLEDVPENWTHEQHELFLSLQPTY